MRSVVALMALMTLAAAAVAQSPPLTLDDFEIHQYVGSRGLSPVSIMRLDTNDEVLIACREPRTRDELEAMGVEAIESQLVLLRAMRMLRLRDGRFETLIPLLDGEQTGRLRAASSALAAEIAAATTSEVEALGRALADRGFADHLYAVLFSYVLDGMAWDFFEEYREVAPRRLTATAPHWAGEIWGTYPPRELAAGTSAVLSGDLSLRVTRPPAQGSAIDRLLADWRALRELLRRHQDPGVAVEPAALERLAAFGVVDEGGELTLPILVEKPEDEIFELAQDVTEKVTAAALERLGLEELERELGLRGRQQALLLAYHELMWDLMEAFEAAGVVERPRLLGDPGGAGPADAPVVAFVVDRRRDGVPGRQDEDTETDED